MSSSRDTDTETAAAARMMSHKQSHKQCCWWGCASNGNGKNGGNGKHCWNGKNGEEEESMDMCEVAKILEGAAKQLGDLAKALASGACEGESDPYLRQKVVCKLRELIRSVCAGAGNDMDLHCLLRALNCFSPEDSE